MTKSKIVRNPDDPCIVHIFTNSKTCWLCGKTPKEVGKNDYGEVKDDEDV